MKANPALRAIIPFLAATVSTLPAAAQPATDGYGPHMWGGGPGWFMGPVMMILFLVVAAFVVMLVFRWLGGTSHDGRNRRTDALDVLRERYARGEIDSAEFDERRRKLSE